MMQAMRHPRTLKYGLWAVLIIIIPSFVAFYGFGNSNAPSSRADLGKAKVVEITTPSGKRELTRADLLEAEDALSREYVQWAGMLSRQQFRPVDVARSIKRREIAEHAVALAGFDELARQEGIFVSREMVGKFLAEQGLTREYFDAVVRESNKTEQQFIDDTRETMRIDRARAAVSRMAHVSLLEMWMEHKLAKERFSIEYVQVPFSKYRSEMEAGEEEIAAYFEKNKSNYVKKEERVYRFVAIAPPPAAAVQVNDGDIETEYAKIDWNSESSAPYQQQPGLEVRQIMLRPTDDKPADVVRGTLEGLRSRIESGEDFGTIANEYTEDADNIEFTGGEQINKRGGVVPTRVHADTLEGLAGTYGETWTESVFGMLPGQLSDVIESNGALFIVRGERVYEKRKTMDECRADLQAAIRERLMAAERDKQKAFIDETELRLKDVVAQSTTLDSIAREMSAEVKETSPMLSSLTSIAGVGSFRSSSAIFAGLEKNVPSPVLRTDARGDAAQTLAVVELAEVLPERANTLDEVRQAVEIAVKGEKSKEKAKAVAEEIRAAVAGGKTLTEAAKEHELTAKDTAEPFEISSPPADLQTMQGTLRNELATAKVGDVKSSESFMDAVIYRVTDRQEPDVAKFLEDMGGLERQFTFAKGAAFIEEYQRQSIRNLKPEFEKDFVAEEDPRVARRRARRAAAAGS